VSAGHKLLAQLLKVINLAIKNDLYRPVFVAHRLLPGGKIDNREAPMRKPDATGIVKSYGLEKAFAIGATVSNRVGHAPERCSKVIASTRRQIAGNSTHGWINGMEGRR